ncbi:peptidoglycan-binding domain-containing protein [Roseobacter sp. N2S]|uniref:peptidoglycan-binding domain-containing protein n=1 Tax=Roseobacter sp. N2S TaxID=2663844 RepID=UPI0028546B71|nr:peptidoglycan-binding domain-containing protein [Roseobacter sp. N2S]MDR6266577.1 peptidoglycan hydrolase-like protein with peptidoglycan-binding domain [Roseobacter sp. N2S]
MYFKTITTAVLAASLAFMPADTAQADAGDFIAGALIGGIVGANVNKNKRTVRSSSYRTTRSRLPSTQEGRSIQSSLNYFGFDAGTVDGQLGRKTRNAVSQYQAYLGYPVTGNMTAFEQNFLLSSYNRAQAGGYAVQQQIATIPDGTRGLLRTYRAEMANQPTAPNSAPQTTYAFAPQPNPTPAAPVVTAAAPLAGASGLAAAAAPATGLPNFMGSGTQASLASHCNTVSLITNTNGGFTTLANMSDPNVVLNEQFCLARTYAIANSQELANKVQGFSSEQIAQQCEGFGPAMQPHVEALALKTNTAVVADVAAFIQSTGMTPAQLGATARICMGVGYRTDNINVALGSALLLYTLGEPVYGELMGHHLSQGFGPAKQINLANNWYGAGLAAVDNGAAPVFSPGQPERTELIRAATHRMAGGGQATMAANPQNASSVGLPTFSVSE